MYKNDDGNQGLPRWMQDDPNLTTQPGVPTADLTFGGAPTPPPAPQAPAPVSPLPDLNFNTSNVTSDPVKPAPTPGPTTPPPPTPPPAAPTAPPPNLFNIGADANNQFGGQTYAGFDPQNHQGANLNDPMNAKYALQQYLTQNGGLTGGPNGNAVAQAAALNAKYGQLYGNANFFTPVDAETIMMPDGQYVHFAPNGHGMQPGTYNPAAGSEVFWGATGSPFSGAAGSGANGGGGGQQTSSSGGTNFTPLLSDIAGLGRNLTPQGGAGPYNPDTVQMNQDPFSQLIAGGYGSMIGSGGVGIAPLNVDLQDQLDQLITGRNPGAGGGIGALQAARGQFDAAHNAMKSTAEADLADRGLMSLPGSPQGPEVTAIDRIMQNLAPSFDSSMGTFLTHAYDQAGSMAQSNNSNMLSALSGAGGYQSNMATIALNTLKENNAFNEFAATFGLDRDKALYEIASGQNTGLANLLAQYLAAANTTSNGHV